MLKRNYFSLNKKHEKNSFFDLSFSDWSALFLFFKGRVYPGKRRSSFDIDADGILHVSAKDLSSGKSQKIKIEAQSGLKEEDIKKMVRDAELHAEEDKKKKEEVELKNEADSLAFRAEKSLKEHKDRLPKNVTEDVQSKIDQVKKALEGNDMGQIKMAKEELETHMQKIGEAMSQA